MVGTGMFNPAVSQVALSSAPPEQSGLAAGVNDMFRQAGIAVGVAALGALVPAGAALGEGSPQAYVDGLHDALWVGAVVALAARSPPRCSSAGGTATRRTWSRTPSAGGVGSADGQPGDLDTTFGSGGKKTVNFGGIDAAQAVLVQPNGRIVAAGGGGPASSFCVVRLRANGTLDPTFGSGGKRMIDFGGDNEAVYGAALQPDGKIVLAGDSRPDSPPSCA